MQVSVGARAGQCAVARGVRASAVVPVRAALPPHGREGAGRAHSRTTARAVRTDPLLHRGVQARRLAVRAKAGEDPVTDTSSEAAEEETETKAARLLAEAVANPLFYVAGGAVAIKLVPALGEQAGAIVVLAALPVVGLTLISKSDVGKKVQENLEAKLPELQAEAEVLAAQKEAACAASPWFGAGRPKFLGPLEYEYPAHLKGQVAGDYGFDPLGFSKDPAAFARNYEAEVRGASLSVDRSWAQGAGLMEAVSWGATLTQLLHARWAMLAVVGALIPEVLSMNGVDLGEPVWWKVGYAKLSGDLTLNYAGIEGFRIAGKQGLWVIAACQLALMGGPEYARYVGIKSLEPVGIFLPGNTNYPGSALFDPLNLSEDPEAYADQAVKEIKNGRIAMLAFLGYAVQAAVTGKGPVENLLDHLADPVHNNILVYL